MNDLLTFPVYAIHSQDDPLTPIITSLGPLARFRELGATVVFDQTNGFRHDVWKYDAGHQRAALWRQHQVRPDSRTVRRLDYAALSETAARAWWAEVAEWGSGPRPAHFRLAAEEDNSLNAPLSNVTRLRLRIGEWPFDRKRALRVSVDGAVPFDVPAPLPESQRKADRDVTDADLEKCHLVLIDTAEQNTMVARRAPQVPVQRTAGKISCGDGFELVQDD